MKTRNRIAIIVLIVGLMQMAGYLVGSLPLRGLGAASGIAPFPKVFCEAEGYEGFAAKFAIEGMREDGSPWALALDPESYSQIRGPYNRRNVYGAAFAYAPRLPEDFRRALLAEALAPGSAMRRELKVPEDLQEVRIVITPRPGESPDVYTYSAY